MKARKTPKLPVQQLFILSLCRFAEPIALTSVFPYLPEMIESFNVPKNKVARWAGIASAVFSLSQALTGVFWGRASDRFGRKPVIITCMLCVMVRLVTMVSSSDLSEGQWVCCRSIIPWAGSHSNFEVSPRWPEPGINWATPAYGICRRHVLSLNARWRFQMLIVSWRAVGKPAFWLFTIIGMGNRCSSVCRLGQWKRWYNKNNSCRVGSSKRIAA